MSEYTATNGVKVSSETQPLTGYRRIKFETDSVGELVEISGPNMQALIEDLDAEKDKELGRWRWPKNPDYVVYPIEGGYSVFDERRGVAEFRNGLYVHDMEGEAARDYALAQPERKIPEEAAYITWRDPADGEDRIALRYGHPANRVWRIGFDTFDEDDLVRDYIGDATVTVLIEAEE